jgi:ADP-ribose pyrophosphatase
MAEDYLERLPLWMRSPGDSCLGEIELLSGGEDPEYGIRYEDPYILVIRDRVRFPNGSVGSYLRIASTSELTGAAGTVMVPLWEEYVVFVRIFRHATRSWEWELPRGFQDPAITEADNARKETLEELGVSSNWVERIGGFNANTGLMTGIIGVYQVSLETDPTTSGRPQSEESITHFEKVLASDLSTWIASGKTRCGITLAALALFLAHRTKTKSNCN